MPTQMAIIKTMSDNKYLQGCEKLESSCIESGHVKWYSQFGKQPDSYSES